MKGSSAYLLLGVKVKRAEGLKAALEGVMRGWDEDFADFREEKLWLGGEYIDEGMDC